MSVYNKYYKTQNFFGEPYPELIKFFEKYPSRGRLLDLGCGQGRDAIALSRLGYEVTGIDSSEVGIQQMMKVAKQENLNVAGQIADIYDFTDFHQYDFVLLDSMFHFTKADKKKEISLIGKIMTSMKAEAILVICIQDTGKKVETLKRTIRSHTEKNYMVELNLTYVFSDSETGHESETKYKMILLEK